MSETPPHQQITPAAPLAGTAALSEATRHVDIIHTSLVGMTAIVLVLLVAVALPVFGYAPVTQRLAFAIMIIASLAGIGYLYYMNYRVHQHVSNQARLTEVLVNSLGQGFLSFNQAALCGRGLFASLHRFAGNGSCWKNISRMSCIFPKTSEVILRIGWKFSLCPIMPSASTMS